MQGLLLNSTLSNRTHLAEHPEITLIAIVKDKYLSAVFN